MMRLMKQWLRSVIAPAVFLVVTAYFGWQATQGERGLQSYAMRQEQLKLVRTDLDRTVLDRDQWERRVAGLKTQRLDPDTLDERARAMLNVADPTDIVVPYPPGKKLF